MLLSPITRLRDVECIDGGAGGGKERFRSVIDFNGSVLMSAPPTSMADAGTAKANGRDPHARAQWPRPRPSRYGNRSCEESIDCCKGGSREIRRLLFISTTSTAPKRLLLASLLSPPGSCLRARVGRAALDRPPVLVDPQTIYAADPLKQDAAFSRVCPRDFCLRAEIAAEFYSHIAKAITRPSSPCRPSALLAPGESAFCWVRDYVR